MSVTTFTIAQGTSADFPVQINDRVTGNPSTTFLGTDVLAVAVWPGDSTLPVAAPAAFWSTNAADGKFRIVFENADSAPVSPGTYAMVVTATRAGRTAVVANLALKVTPRPGTDVTATTFTTIADLTLYAPWLADLQSGTDQANFAEQQVRATLSLVSTLSAAWHSSGSLSLGDPGFFASQAGGGLASAFWLRQQLTPLVPGSTPPASMPNRKTTLPNFFEPRISTALLVYPEVKEYCARLAIAYVCEVQVGSQRDYRVEAARQRHEAANVFRCGTFEVDLSTPQTGYGVVISGGSSSLLR